MSALLPHIKSHRAMAKALHGQAGKAPVGPEVFSLLMRIAWAHEAAATDLEEQARAEATGESGATFRSLTGEARTVGGKKPTHGMGSR